MKSFWNLTNIVLEGSLNLNTIYVLQITYFSVLRKIKEVWIIGIHVTILLPKLNNSIKIYYLFLLDLQKKKKISFFVTIAIVRRSLNRKKSSKPEKQHRPNAKPAIWHYIILFSTAINTFCLLSEWGWTARNVIARQSFARHFWQQINCSTRNW